MEVQLTADQKAFLSDAIRSGRYTREEDALIDALSLWEARERARAELVDSVRQAEYSLAQGAGRDITEESVRLLASEVKSRGRERFAAEPIQR